MDVLITFVTKHYYFAFPMFAMSIIAIALVVWRILLNKAASTNLNAFLPAFQEKLEKGGVDGALQLCKATPGFIPQRLFVAGLETSKQGLSAMRRAMASVIELEILPDLNFLLAPILAIAKIATMVGLLGTVISMVGTFSELSQVKDKKDVAAQGSDIGLALMATALGLITAIPLVFSHVMFKAWVANFEIKMKSAAQKLLLIMQSAKTPAAPMAATAVKPAPQPAGR